MAAAAGIALVLQFDVHPQPPSHPIYSRPRPSAAATFASFTLTKPFTSTATRNTLKKRVISRNTLQKKSYEKCRPNKVYRINVAPLFSPPPMRVIFRTTLRFVTLEWIPQVLVSWYLLTLVTRDSLHLFDENSLILIDEITSGVQLDSQLKILFHRLRQKICQVFIHRVQCLLVVRCFSLRIARKLLKDPSASAARKAKRDMSCLSYIFRVTKTTIISNFAVLASSWSIGAGVRIGKLVFSMAKSDAKVDWAAVLQNERNFFSAAGCVKSLIFPALGAGIFSAIFRPQLGHWIGYDIGKFARRLNFRRRIGLAFLIRQITEDNWKWRSLPINFCITLFPENVPRELRAELPGCNIAISLSVFEFQFIWLLAVRRNRLGSEDWEMLHNWLKLISTIGSNEI